MFLQANGSGSFIGSLENQSGKPHTTIGSQSGPSSPCETDIRSCITDLQGTRSGLAERPSSGVNLSEGDVCAGAETSLHRTASCIFNPASRKSAGGKNISMHASLRKREREGAKGGWKAKNGSTRCDRLRDPALAHWLGARERGERFNYESLGF